MKWFIINVCVVAALAVTGEAINRLLPGHDFIEQLTFFAIGYVTHYFQCKETPAGEPR